VSLRDGRRAWPTGDSWRPTLLKARAEAYLTTEDLKYEPIVADRPVEPELGAPSVNLLAMLPECVATLYA